MHASVVLLQPESQGRSLLTLWSGGKYYTFINKQAAVGTTSELAVCNRHLLKVAYDKLRKAENAYRAELPLRLTLDLDNLTRQINSTSIVGINHRYAFNGYSTFNPKQYRNGRNLRSY